MVVGTDGSFVPEWNRIVLDAIGEEADLLFFHAYVPGFEHYLSYLRRERRDPDGVYYAMVGAGAEIERRISWTEDTLRGSLGPGSHLRLALDEWNLWWKPVQTYRAVFTMREAPGIAGILNALHRNAHIVEMANIAQLVNVLGLILVEKGEVRLNSIYHPFLLFAREAGRFLVPVEVKSDSYCTPPLGLIPALDKVPYLDASATLSLGKDRVALFLVNRHLQRGDGRGGGGLRTPGAVGETEHADRRFPVRPRGAAREERTRGKRAPTRVVPGSPFHRGAYRGQRLTENRRPFQLTDRGGRYRVGRPRRRWGSSRHPLPL